MFLHPPRTTHILLNMTTIPYIIYYKHVRNLDLSIESTLSLDTHIIHMHTSINYHLHCFRLIRRSIPLLIAVTIALSLELPTLPPSNNYINLLLQMSSKYILFLPCFLPNTLISPTDGRLLTHIVVLKPKKVKVKYDMYGELIFQDTFSKLYF